MRFLKLLFFVTTFIISTLLILPYFIKWDNYKQSIIADLKKQTGYNLSINGNILGSLLPFFKLQLIDINLSQDDTTKSNSSIKSGILEIYVNPLYFINKKIDITSIALIDSKISLVNHNDPVYLDNLKEIKLLNSSLSYKKDDEVLVDDLKIGNLSLKNKKGKIDLSFTTSPKQGLNPISTDLLLDLTNNQLKGKIYSDDINTSFEGNINKDLGDISIIGNVTGNGNINVLAKYLFSKNISDKISSKEQVSFVSDFAISSSEANFNNASITSDNVQAKGYFNGNFKNQPVINLDFSFDKLDLDALSANGSDTDNNFNQMDEVEKRALDKLMSSIKSSTSNLKFSLSQDMDLLAMISIKNLRYLNKNIRSTKLSAEIHGKIMDIYYMNLDINESTKLSFSGSLSSNSFRPILQGRINIDNNDLNSLSDWLGYSLSDKDSFLKGNYLKINSDISLTPEELSLSSIEGEITKYPINGSMKVEFDPELPNISLELDMDLLDINQLNILTTEKIKNFANNINDKASLLKNIGWLRNINSELNLMFNIGQFNFNDQNITDLSGSLILLPDTAKIEDLTINGSNNSFIADALIDIKSLNPRIELSLNGDSLYIDNLNDYLFQGEEIRIPPFEWFDGKITLKLNKLTMNDLIIKEFNADCNIDKQILNIDNLSGKVFGGSLLARGSLISSRPSIGVSFSLNNIMASKLLFDVPYLNNIDAYMSLSGSVITEGKTIKQLTKNSQASASFEMRDFKIGNFDLDSIIKSYNPKNKIIDNDLNKTLISYLNSGESLFYSANGNITMSRGIIQIPNLNLNHQRAPGIISASMDLNSKYCELYSKFSFFPSQGSKSIILKINLVGPVDSLNKTITQSDEMVHYYNKNYKR